MKQNRINLRVIEDVRLGVVKVDCAAYGHTDTSIPGPAWTGRAARFLTRRTGSVVADAAFAPTLAVSTPTTSKAAAKTLRLSIIHMVGTLPSTKRDVGRGLGRIDPDQSRRKTGPSCRAVHLWFLRLMRSLKPGSPRQAYSGISCIARVPMSAPHRMSAKGRQEPDDRRLGNDRNRCGMMARQAVGRTICISPPGRSRSLFVR
jgi:hypothetical protein